MRTLIRLAFGILASIALESSQIAWAQECTRGNNSSVTDDYFFEASTDQGAVGDFAAIDVSLSIVKYHERLNGFIIVGCYDPALAELIETPSYAELFDQVAPLYNFFTLGQQRPGGRRGFVLYGSFRTGDVERMVGSGQLPIMTLFFRLKGKSGEAFAIDFCDGEFKNRVGSCVDNTLLYSEGVGNQRQIEARSTRHVQGQIRILPGPPTRTELPSIPPDAKVYDQSPSAEETAARFEVVGSVATPGSTEVPVRVFITSAHFPRFLMAISVGHNS